MLFTAPVEVPVVAAANRPLPGAPILTSLPSRLPPDCVTDSDWSAPALVSSGLPFCSANIANAPNATRIVAITAISTRPWLLSRASRPNATTNENGISRSAQMARMLVMPFGLLKGCAELALKKPPPFVPSCLIASCEASGPPGIDWVVIAVDGSAGSSGV